VARIAQTTREILAPHIRARGPVSATELAAVLRVNRTTIARTLPDFGDELVTLGATRSTRYLLRREIRHIGNRWPVYQIDADGHPQEWAELEALHPHAWRITWANSAPAWAEHFLEETGLWSGFPFFLGDMRPQGFLGGIIARQISGNLQLPEDPRQWSDEDTLIYLHGVGEDAPGNLVVGNDCLRRALRRQNDRFQDRVIDESDRTDLYPQLALHANQTLLGSSAGGDQPKFLAALRTGTDSFQPVIVKFTAPQDQPTGRRWADLLLGEFHAHEILAQNRLALAGALILDAEGRRFLEVPRFDRMAAGGRRGVVSLEALHAAAVGTNSRNWPDAAAQLQRLGLIDEETLSTIQRLYLFGELIGNTDMHFGNLSFFLDDTLPLQPTPSYDMLPMLWAPGSQGELIERDFRPLPPLPSMTEQWREAADWAESFWGRLIADDRLSNGFRPSAESALTQIRQLRRQVGG